MRLFTERTGRPFPAAPWDALVACVEAVFRSWNNERAITYRREHDVRNCIGTAVTVQSMFPSEVSGIVFTTNPNRPDAGEMIIEASYGLGEAVVSGDVHPDNFVLDRGTLAVRRRTAGRKTHIVRALGDRAPRDPDAFSLDEAQVTALGRLAMDVERFFGQPMDIEFGLAGGRFALLQSRAIRGLDIAEDVEEGRREEVERLREIAGDKRMVWVRHNISETLPAPTPLTWDIVREFMAGDGGFGRMYKDFGYQPGARVCRDGFLELICGQVYADPARAAELFWERLPLAYDLDAVAKNPKLLDTAPDKLDIERADAHFLAALPRQAVAMIRMTRRLRRLRAAAAERFEKEVLPPYLAWVKEKRAQKLGGLAAPALLAELDARVARVLQVFGGESLKPGFFAGIAQAALTATLTQVLGQTEGTRVALALTQGLDGDTTVEQGCAMADVARSRLPLADFIEAYGHRAVAEMELARPRWREDATYVRQVLRVYLDPHAPLPHDLHARNVTAREQTERELPALLAQWGASSLRETIMADLRDAQRLLPYRESGKHYLMMGYETIRQALVELGERWGLGRDVFFLHREELPRFESDRDKLLPEIAQRKIRWQSAQRLELADVVDTRELENLGQPRQYAAAPELAGEPVAAGVATGVSQIVFDPLQTAGLCTDYVLVCPSTDPSWTALFVHARGLVVERGGVLSHGAIVARDFGIPAVVCPDATRRIPHGARIRVDGNQGKITILDGGGPKA